MNDRLWTWPNVISFARLLGVPLFLWLVLIKADWWALGILVFSGLSDWADGKLARMLDQTSRIGTLLDPAADRLYVFATLVGLVARDIVPLWFAAVLVLREVFVGGLMIPLRRLGYGAFPVHFVGKAATLCLLYAFPLLLLGAHSGTYADIAKVLGWAFAVWGTGLYWWAAVLYATQLVQLMQADRAGPAPVPEAGGRPLGHQGRGDSRHERDPGEVKGAEQRP